MWEPAALVHTFFLELTDQMSASSVTQAIVPGWFKRNMPGPFR